MSAELLREAAALMRERVEAATPGPWQWVGDHLVWPSMSGPGANDPVAAVGEAHEESAEHIASWHPDVALAVADWLDDTAATREDPYYRENYDDLMPPALVVARAYLGRDA